MAKTTSEIRSAFLEFFARNGHEIVPSASLIPQNDPTLLFNNAGMVQFKDVFTGQQTRPYKRAASSQKCIRISGKHNDLEEVGPSPRHQTFFEMLGNFSFGDYFKEEAIVFAWEFLTKDLDLPKERLAFTYFRGEEGIEPDYEARDLWKKVTGFGDDRIQGLGMADNFWSMGDTGPCGPCSEIYFYRGDNPSAQPFSDQQAPDGSGWMEIWNLVFMQFERSLVDGKGVLAPLPRPSIDTGAGLERLASVVQGVSSNYGVDLLSGLVELTAEIAKKPYGASMSPDDVSMRVVADHARTTAFLIAEGILPEKTGREYVLRRVMRRAIRHGHRLGIREPFLHLVAERVVDTMGDHYPELRERAELIKSVAEGEEVRFRQTIERGLGLLDEKFEAMEREGKTELDGRSAFMLFDTYGFPVDLTAVVCRERGLTVDMAGYEEALKEARDRSKFDGPGDAVQGVYREARALVPGENVAFTGYDRDTDQGRIVALIVDGKLVQEAEPGSTVEVVTERTPFYGAGGGQIGDHGEIRVGEARVTVDDTEKPLTGLVVHQGKLEGGPIRVGDEAQLAIDRERREATRRNHSATHLVHYALRKVLGGHAQQKGSLVGPDRLRFDFTHNSPLEPDEIKEIEQIVNRIILENHPIRTEVLSMAEAKTRGAMMIFEEKYGDTVRLLTMGPSVELCGGTHARETGELGLFKITSEQGVAAGVRRLFATTGLGSLAYVHDYEAKLKSALELTKATPDTLTEKIEKLLERQKKLEQEIQALEKKLITGGGGGIDALLSQAREIGGVKVLGVRVEITNREALRELAEQLRDKLGDAIVLVGAPDGDKASLVLMVSKSITDRYRAGDLIKAVAAHVGGSGGGRPDMAQAGGPNVAGLGAALEAIYGVVQA
ncbi:MAG: alanine--tRNA ligase [Sorangiineae bacterium NIC37A_2]|jgi:alanyl-tRNA synthetase|nr:MAG: alanine--tRNA ligase [Sorangiineae bacterium NIC37A_2]